EFIPIAEATGLILPIGEWVLRTACAEVATWERSCRLSVNIAAAQLTQTDLPAIVHTVLLETGLPPSRLELEITEASLIEDSR
ncbi:EAL domain-containing protein, partial [Rhizobiaceae sp. 2RAB30]